MGDPHAVRWASSKGLLDYNWTKWHWTTNSNSTLCGRLIRLANNSGSFLPETDDLQDKVTCKRCRAKLDRGGHNG